MTTALFTGIGREIAAATGRPFAPAREDEAGGGCINRTFLLEGGGERYFVKLNGAERLSMFEAEAEGLKEMAATETVRVPIPLCSGVAEGQAFLVLEYLPLHASDTHAQETLGRQLARMHHVTAPTFGWRRDNTIGSTPQPNTPMADWVTFWRDQRLGFQLQLAANSGGRTLRGKGEQLLEQLPTFFADYRPVASLLHGDLWGGNTAATADGEPVIFDPAVYYGDREADLAMTELFGGFSARFHAAYHEAWPLDAGYRVRKNLYNLYHVLNHFNLFGGGYGAQALHLIERLLAETH
ncbi:MAG: fructosamine kinase family protein [Gammaproteobacteria bacterium]|nr:fructosamine kinase family protein [Gammaproteobacteria bacterium]